MPGIEPDRPDWVFFEAAPLPMYVVDSKSFLVRFANRAAQAHFGYNESQMAGLSLDKLYLPEDLRVFRERRAGAAPLQQLVRHRKADGTLIDVEITATPLRQDGAEAVMVLARDVTADRAAERQRLADAEMLRIAGQAASIGGWRADLETGQVTWSAETCAIFGVAEGTALDLDTALGFITPDARIRLAEAFRRCAENGTPYDFDVGAQRQDGTLLSLRAIGQPIRDDSGRIIAVQGAVQDMSRLRSVERSLAESNRMMRDFAEAMPHIVWFGEPDGTISYASSRIKRPTEGDEAFDLARDWGNLIHPDDREMVAKLWAESVTHGTPFETEARLLRDPALDFRWHHIVAQPLHDGEGRLLRWFGISTDVHDRRHAEAESRRAAETLTATLDSITDAFLTLDHDWRITYLNREAARVLRQSAEDLLGRNLWDAFPEARGTRFQEEYEAAAAQRVTRVFQAYYPPLSVWFDVRAYPSDEGLTLCFRDVSAQRESDQRLRLLELAISRINDCVLITEAEPLEKPGPRIIFVNEAFTAQSGHAIGEVIGKTPRILQGPETERAALQRIGTALRRWKPVREELLNYRRDGTTFWIELDIVPLVREDGFCTHWVGVQRDITERKTAEVRAARHAAQLEATVTALAQLNALTERGPALTERVLAHAAALTGASGAALLTAEGDGLSVSAATGSASQLGSVASGGSLAASVLATGRAMAVSRQSMPDAAEWAMVETGAVTALCAAGIDAPPTPRGVLLVTINGSDEVDPTVINSLQIYAGAVGVLLQRHHVEDQLRQAQRLEAIGQLTGGIAHDFNNLLTIILGNAELLVESLATDDDLRLLAQMTQTAAERGAELTSRLLAFARRQALAPRATDVAVLLLGMDGLLRRSLGEQVRLSVVHGDGLWPAMVDAPQLESALLNLSINARDAMQNGGALTIETGNAYLDAAYAEGNVEVRPGAYVVIAVSDTGTGMTPEIMARAFEPFFTTKPVGQGSGLGLSMVFGFAKQSRGHVKIYSEPGHGTTIRLYLPRAMVDADAASEGGDTIHPTGHERILLVEDDDLVREHVTAQLRDLGYQVVAARDAAEALGILKADAAIDLLFTDIVMPGGMNGRALADEARRIIPSLPVLFTSGYAENALVHNGRLDPGVDLLPKPYRRTDLAAKLRAVLRGERAAGST